MEDGRKEGGGRHARGQKRTSHSQCTVRTDAPPLLEGIARERKKSIRFHPAHSVPCSSTCSLAYFLLLTLTSGCLAVWPASLSRSSHPTPPLDLRAARLALDFNSSSGVQRVNRVLGYGRAIEFVLRHCCAVLVLP
eukprot:515070-Rhodomonas_salina.2